MSGKSFKFIGIISVIHYNREETTHEKKQPSKTLIIIQGETNAKEV